MSDALNAGIGLCKGTDRLTLHPTAMTAEMGAGRDIVLKILNLVHHINRQGSPEDYIAVGLPELHLMKERRLAGHTVDLIGSEAVFETMMASTGFTKLQRMQAIMPAVLSKAELSTGETGMAFVRDRSTAKLGPAKLRRMQKRAEEFGRSFEMPKNIERSDSTLHALHYGQAVLRIREIDGLVTDDPLQVTTYGFSHPATPAFLPIARKKPQQIPLAA